MQVPDILYTSPLFAGFKQEEIQAALYCLKAKSRTVAEGEVLLRAGDRAVKMGLVLSGSVHIIRYDAWGAQSILDRVGPGQVFAETYAFLKEEPLMVYAVAAQRARILFLDVDGLLSSGAQGCGLQAKVLASLLRLTAKKNIMLTRKINCITPKTIRARLLSYLSFQAAAHGSRSFSIPYNRQQLADYLSVDRSALSAELSKMGREGLIRFRKNQFTLCTDEIE